VADGGGEDVAVESLAHPLHDLALEGLGGLGLAV
jgi:hypothetical protein